MCIVALESVEADELFRHIGQKQRGYAQQKKPKFNQQKGAMT